MIKLDDLTIGQARELARIFGDASNVASVNTHPFVGRYVILRCYSAGVHAGRLVSQDGDRAILADARRLWSWKAKGGVALSGLAVHGLASGKIDTKLVQIALTGVIETIPCTVDAEASINAA
jgi:hypothetical protein